MNKYAIWSSLVVIPLLYAVLRGVTPWEWQKTSGICLHWVLAAIVLYWAHRNVGGPEGIGLRKAVIGFVCFALIVTAYCIGLTAWFGSLPLGDWQWGILSGFGRWGFMVIAITAGFCEEVIYRGYMMTALKKLGHPAWIAMVLSSLSFLFFHGVLPLPLMVVGFVIAMAWAAIFHWTSILWVTIYLHAFWDATVALVPWESLAGAN